MQKLKYICALLIAISSHNTITYSQKTDDPMTPLSEKLIHTISGHWTRKGFSDDLHYIYSLSFSEKNKVIFTYYTRTPSTVYSMPVMRSGTFETQGDTLIIHFSDAKGERFGRPLYSDEPLPENLYVTFELKVSEYKTTTKEHRGKAFSIAHPDYIPKDIEITEYKLVAKQISGENIFEDHSKGAKIELIAERPIID